MERKSKMVRRALRPLVLTGALVASGAMAVGSITPTHAWGGDNGCGCDHGHRNQQENQLFIKGRNNFCRVSGNLRYAVINNCGIVSK